MFESATALLRHASRLGPAHFSTSSCACALRKLTRVNIVDNSALGMRAAASGRAPRVIHVYTKTGVAGLGSRVLLAVAGEKRQAVVVGVRRRQKPTVPRFDSNNVVLVDEGGSPLGTRISVPLPAMLRKPKFAKICALAPKFV